jgi:hypothetical protein
MKFNDTTNDTGICQDIDFLVGTNATSYPLKDKARNVNSWYSRIINWILSSNGEWDFDDKNLTDFPIATTNLVASQQDYQLPLSDDILIVLRVEITFDGSNWYRVNPIDLREIGEPTTPTKIAQNFSKTEPYYDLFANSILIYPIPDINVSAGLKIWYKRNNASAFTASDTTKEPGFDSQFHRALSYGGAYDWAVKKGDNDKIQFLLGEILKYEAEIKEFYGNKQKDRVNFLRSAINLNDYE